MSLLPSLPFAERAFLQLPLPTALRLLPSLRRHSVLRQN